VVAFDIEAEEFSAAEELKGASGSKEEEDTLRKSVLQNDKAKVEKGQILNEALNQGIMSFHPDMMFSNIVKNFQVAENLYGDQLLRLITGYHADALKRNVKIPEFQKELRMAIERKVNEMKDSGILNKEGEVSEEGIFLASLVMYAEELDRIYSGTAKELVISGRQLMTSNIAIDLSNQNQLKSWVAITEAARNILGGDASDTAVATLVQAICSTTATLFIDAKKDSRVADMRRGR